MNDSDFNAATEKLDEFVETTFPGNSASPQTATLIDKICRDFGCSEIDKQAFYKLQQVHGE